MAKIDDGHGTKYTFSENPTVKFWEKSVTPPGLSGGGANDTTTLRNETFRTKAPRKLLDVSDSSCTVAYDPEVFSDILDMLLVNQEITVTFPDGATLKFWGWVDTFTPGACEEGSQPTADITVIVSNQNASGEETPYTYTAGA